MTGVSEETSDKKQRIMDAAIKLMSEKGYHGATTAAIAKEAGVSQGIIFHYFKSKEELFFSLLKEESRKFREKIKKSIGEEENPLKKIEIVVQTYCHLVKKEEKSFEFLTKQVRGSGLNFEKIKEFGLTGSVKLIRQILKEGIDQGVIKEIDLDTATVCLFGMMDHNALRWMIYRKSFSLSKAGKVLTDIFFQGIARDLKLR